MALESVMETLFTANFKWIDYSGDRSDVFIEIPYEHFKLTYLMKCTFLVLSAMNIEKPELGGPIENWNESPSIFYWRMGLKMLTL